MKTLLIKYLIMIYASYFLVMIYGAALGRDILEEYYIGQQYSLIEEYLIILTLVITIDLIRRTYKWIIYGFTRA